jgi:TolB-like protein/tRNA A-37 threonylcarbamoyl transferase component Bud32/Flp pilus assembly protein TadD
MSDAMQRLTAALADRYRIERELGAGGMATVYLAQDLKHDRQVAIKVLREDLSASLGAGRFLREIKIAAQLQHPHILPLLDSGEADGFLYFVMPYIKGQSLRERLDREGELPVHESVRLITEVVDALVEAHEHGVVHRDIKPDNVMLSGRHALVTDFGVAKAISEATGRNTVTTLGVAVGTPTYMSPEQAAADPHVDHRSDIYSVGVMAYEMLSGRPPFTGSTPQQVLAAHVTEAPDPVSRRRPAIPQALEQIVMRCLAKRPADRWQTAAELHAALEPLGTPSSGMTPTQTQPVTGVGISRRLPLLVGAVAVLGLVAVAAWRIAAGRGANTSARAIAVLPFDNVGKDTAFDYLADGIANDVRSGLMKLPGLSVKARTSSEAARGKPLHDAGALLNVGVILQGTFRRTADKTTVTVDLVNVADESALWTGTYVMPADGNFAAAQDSITGAVARTLHLSAAAAGTNAQAQRGTKDLEAYDLYLKGQYFFAKRGGENLHRAVDYFQRAIARDPNFARAYAGQAMVLTVLPGYTQVADDSLPGEAARLARRALAIDSTLLDGHLALANVLAVGGSPVEAEPEFLAVLARDPRNVTGRQWHADNLAILGRVDEAVREGRMAVDLDPLSAVAGNDLAYGLINAGRFDEAVQVAHRVLELDATFGSVNLYLGLAFAFAQRPDSAQLTFEHFFRFDSLAPDARASRVWEFALAGRWTEAERELAATDRTITGGSRDVDLAMAYTALGNKAAALDALERAARAHSFYIANTALGCDPTFGPLKSEPRFLAVVKALGQGICAATPKWPIPTRTRQ